MCPARTSPPGPTSTAARAYERPMRAAGGSSGSGPGPAPRSTPRTKKASIVVTELPYQVNKAKLLERVADLVKDRKIEGITDIRDESDRDGLRVVYELKRGRPAPGGPEPAFQAHQHADHLWHQHVGHREQPARGALAQGHPKPFHRPPAGGHPKAHSLWT